MKHLFRFLFFLFALLGAYQTQAQITCGVSDQNLPDSTIRLMGQAHKLLADQRARKATSPRNICRVAVEIDSDTYLAFDKDTNRIRSEVVKQIEIVSQIYEREINTQLVVVRIHIWKDTEPDPYRGITDSFVAFSALKETWGRNFKEIAYDKITYLFTKSYKVGLGNLGGAESMAGLTYSPVLAHEIGHSFGSPHTHHCSWSGGPIDYCANIEGGNCYSGSLEQITGTIMSYCDFLPLHFHPLCQTLMTNHADKNFPKLTSAPDKAPVLPTQISFSGSRFLYWNGQPLAERYDIEVAETTDFSHIVFKDTTSISGYNVSQLRTGKPYFIRVKSVNRFGQSAWSAVSQLQLIESSGIIPAPALLLPTQDQRLIYYNNGLQSFSVQPVDGATAYELETSSLGDDGFYNSAKSSYKQPAFSVTVYRAGGFLWRVRAIIDNRRGPWSEIGRFFISAVPSNIYLPFNLAPLRFPVSYYPVTYGLSVRMSLSTDSLSTQVVSQKSIQATPDYTFVTNMIEDLRPNTQYYLTVEEINEGQDYMLPSGILSRTKVAFKTGSSPLPTQWSFINSSTHKNLANGRFLQFIPLTNVAWSMHFRSGLLRINQDSLTIQNFNRNATNGKIGNVNLGFDGKTEGSPLVTNTLTTNSTIAFQGAQLNQISGVYSQSGNSGELSFYKWKFADGQIIGFNANPQMIYTSKAIFIPKADSTVKIYELPPNRSINSINQFLTRPGLVWMIQYNSENSSYELVQFNPITKATRAFSYENTPQLGKSLFDLAVDALGNLWVSQSSTTYPFPPLAKFDGTSWTNFKSPAIPINYALNLANDPFGNLYVVDNSSPRKLYRYDGQSWKAINDMPNFNNLGKMSTDGRGNIWFNGNFQLIRYNPCATIAAPKLSATKQSLEVGESVTLRAEGCTTAIWSWSSTSETVNEQLMKGTNELIVKPTLNTTYRARCYEEGCSGTEAKLTLAVLPKLSLVKTNKAIYCPGDYLTATIGVQGSVEATNQYTLILKTGTQTTRYATTGSGPDLSMPLAASLSPGRYVVYAESSQPATRSRDSVQVVIATPPTAELSSTKAGLMPGDSTRISVALTGVAPWQFTRWDNQPVQAAISPYVATFVARQQASTYTLTLSALSDAICSTGSIKNTLSLKLIVLANDPSAAEGISVYPNPTSGKLLIEVAAPSSIAALRLTNLQGREVDCKTLSVPSRAVEWDITPSPTGTYLLRVETTDGKAPVWKVVKQ